MKTCTTAARKSVALGSARVNTKAVLTGLHLEPNQVLSFIN
jgi:hypothetical protein